MTYIDEEREERRLDAKVRRIAKRHGYHLKKCRSRMFHVGNYGGYMVIDPYNNMIVAGENYDVFADAILVWEEEGES